MSGMQNSGAGTVLYTIIISLDEVFVIFRIFEVKVTVFI